MADFILRAWDIRRAALTGREANGGDSMALIIIIIMLQGPLQTQ
jgi:hypothetical protein